MIVKDAVCSSIRMRAQGCPRFAMWSFENEHVTRGSVTLRFVGTHMQDIEEVFDRENIACGRTL